MSKALAIMAESAGVSKEEMHEVVRGMIISSKNQHGSSASNAEMAVVSSICAKYDLNPLVSECAAFVSGGKLQMVVMIAGWYKMVNRQETFDGVEFVDSFDDNGKLTATNCKMYLTNRSRPVCVTEYLGECSDPKSSVWRKYPARMLRHKAYIQAARMAFGISEVIDDDEKSRITGNSPAPEKNVTPQVDFKAIEQAMAECGDLDTLKAACGDIRVQLQNSGQWDSSKAVIVGMNTRHKDRINSAYGEDVDVEFTEVEPEAQESEFIDGDFIEGEFGE